MDRIELAERRYRDLVPERLVARDRPHRYGEFPVHGLLAWLEQDVCAAGEELWGRPTFQQLAAWPQRTLAAGCDSAERRLVEVCDAALVAAARALAGLARSPSIARELDRALRSGPPEGSQPLRRGQSSATAELTRGVVGRAQAEAVARRDWTDLVCVEDYFGPVGDRTRLPASGVTAGEFVIAFNPELSPVGDFVTRCLFIRIESRRQGLDEFRRWCSAVFRAGGRRPRRQVASEETEAWRDLAGCVTRLRQACLAGPEFRLRDSAVALVQVCAEFAPVPELRWLGLPAGQVEGARGRLRHAVTNARDLETVERIAAALGDLRGLSRGLPAPDAAFEEAVAIGGLVLRGSPRTAYWQKQRINQEWQRYDSPWQLLWRLADRARLGAAVGCRDLYDEGVVDSTVHNRWRRLKALLPPTLAREVEPGTERATYRLKLGAAQIHLFPAGPEERPAGAEGTTG